MFTESRKTSLHVHSCKSNEKNIVPLIKKISQNQSSKKKVQYVISNNCVLKYGTISQYYIIHKKMWISIFGWRRTQYFTTHIDSLRTEGALYVQYKTYTGLLRKITSGSYEKQDVKENVINIRQAGCVVFFVCVRQVQVCLILTCPEKFTLQYVSLD